VSISPAYRRPLKGQPSAASAASVGRKTRLLASATTSAVARDTGAYAPMPPVFGPVSPSPTRL